MEFLKVIAAVVGDFEAERLNYALIGGFAMAVRGVQRATMDLDFILMLQDLPRADAVLTRHGYQRVFHTENVSHYLSADQSWGRIDLLHAFRSRSMGMLDRAERVGVTEGLALRVVQVEDLIGLKVQALVNDPSRAEGDWSDIRLLVDSARECGRAMDWELVADYLAVFHLEAKLPELKGRHEQTD